MEHIRLKLRKPSPPGPYVSNRGAGASFNIGLGPSKPTASVGKLRRSSAVSGLYYRFPSAQHVAPHTVTPQYEGGTDSGCCGLLQGFRSKSNSTSRSW
eukprot:90373-Rhodomonas_salina.1